MAKKLDASSTLFPKDALISISHGAGKLDAEEWNSLGIDLWSNIQTAINSRSTLEQNLQIWTALYEMDIPDSGDDERWEDSANIFIPVVPSELDAMVSYLAAQIFVQRFIIVSGNTQAAADSSNQVERYYNAELVRKRGQTTWLNDLKTVMHLGLRDGTAILEAVWRTDRRKQLTPVFEPVMDADGISPLMDSNGQPVTKRIMVEQMVTRYDDVQFEAVLLKDFLIMPSESCSIDDAIGVAKAEWPTEARLMEMVKDELLDEEEVEKALSYVPSGTSDVSGDRQGTYDKEIGGQIDIGEGMGSTTSKFFANRGPIKMWRVHSCAYDMNRDGIPEENVFWIHEGSNRMIGWAPYEYVVPERPFFSWSPFPRPKRFYGYSLVERLADLQAEINAIHNQRRDAIDLHLSPPFLEKQGVEIQNKGMRWGPNAKWIVEDHDAITVLQIPQMPPDAAQEEALLNSYVAKLTGNDAPQLGAGSATRRSATEAKQKQAASTVRSTNVSMNFRYFCRNVFDFVHRLKLQYLPDNPDFFEGDQKYAVSRDVLARDYRIEVAGASDPLDANSRRMEAQALFAQLSQYPDIMQDAVKRYELLKMFLEANDIVPDKLAGTEQEAKQKQQQEQQMAQMQAQAAAQGGQPQGGKLQGLAHQLGVA